MNDLPVPLQRALRPFQRRLAAGLFLNCWPTCAAIAVAVAASVALVCRLLVPAAAPYLPWLWLSPLIAIVPALALCHRRRYSRTEIVALADSACGAGGVLMAVAERADADWAASLASRVQTIPLPRLQPWRPLRVVALSLVVLAIACALPQRDRRTQESAALAGQIVADVAAAVAMLKQEQLITPEDEKKLAEEIERLRKSASERMDASAWEAADAMKEKLAADVQTKRDAVAWAQEALARYAAAAQSGGAKTGSDQGGGAGSEAAELREALRRLSEAGMLAGAPADLADLANGRRALPGDAESLRRLSAALGDYLDGRSRALRNRQPGRAEAGRFDPSEFPLDYGTGPDGDGDPGRGGVNRGRADAPLVWGKETAPFDRFKAQALPPGFARSADDWAPVAVLPGTPQAAPESSVAGAAHTYAAGAGQEAWRRTLAPRHQSVVRKYFQAGHR